MAFGLGLKAAGIIYGNGMRRLSEAVSCPSAEGVVILDILEGLPARSVGDWPPLCLLSVRCHPHRTVLTKSRGSIS